MKSGSADDPPAVIISRPAFVGFGLTGMETAEPHDMRISLGLCSAADSRSIQESPQRQYVGEERSHLREVTF
jgi:hypothetical protein